MSSIVPQLVADYYNAYGSDEEQWYEEYEEEMDDEVMDEEEMEEEDLNPYEMDEEDFKNYFRFTPVLALKLIKELGSLKCSMKILPENQHSDDLPFDKKCLVAFNFYATGAYLNQTWSIDYMSLDTITKAIEEVSERMELLLDKYIVFPQKEEERSRIAGEFGKKGIPGIIGLIDSTHIRLTGLKEDEKVGYLNRKGVPSINTVLAVNDQNIITYTNARYPSSCTDSYIFGSSLLLDMFVKEYTTPEAQKYWILGDKDFPLMPFLITANDKGTTRRQQEFYNRHKIIRSQFGRALGIFRNRFRCIHEEGHLPFDAPKSCRIINAVAACHNYLILNNYEDEYSTTTPQNELPPVNTIEPNSDENPYLPAGRQIRQIIIDNLHVTIFIGSKYNNSDSTAQPASKSETEVSEVEKKLTTEIETLTKEIKTLNEKNFDLLDKYKRSLADSENLRKRLTKQIDDAKIFGIQSFCKDLLEVADILGAATEAVPKDQLTSNKNPDLKNLYDGLEMTKSSLSQVFKRHGLVPLNPLNEKFNPNYHEALFQAENSKVEPNTVISVSKIGYKLQERCIRPALVGVSK